MTALRQTTREDIRKLVAAGVPIHAAFLIIPAHQFRALKAAEESEWFIGGLAASMGLAP
jgi:hypothetical protein